MTSKKATNKIENKIFDAIENHGGNAATYVIAWASGMKGKTSETLKVMKKLEAAGKVKRHKNTESNCIYWMNATARTK